MALEKREKRMVELLTLPSLEDMSSAEGQGEGAVASAIV
jgi:hypothetical protein